jgi:hypothetical protein
MHVQYCTVPWFAVQVDVLDSLIVLVKLVLELIHYGFPRDFKKDAREKELAEQREERLSKRRTHLNNSSAHTIERKQTLLRVGWGLESALSLLKRGHITADAAEAQARPKYALHNTSLYIHLYSMCSCVHRNYPLLCGFLNATNTTIGCSSGRAK